VRGPGLSPGKARFFVRGINRTKDGSLPLRVYMDWFGIIDSFYEFDKG